MAKKNKNEAKVEYGDFQTPAQLAAKVIAILAQQDFAPQTIIEPTCGYGNFLIEAIRIFPDANRYIGVEINADYLSYLRNKIKNVDVPGTVEIIQGDFFLLDWPRILKSIVEPVLIIGNPPWVTSSDLGTINSQNLPSKSNFHARRGYDAITGKSNFDISEWMLLKYLEWLKEIKGVIAILCKTSIARKILFYLWKNKISLSSSQIFHFDAHEYFGASVDACFLVLNMLGGKAESRCLVYSNLDSTQPVTSIGYNDGFVVSNMESYSRWRHLTGTDDAYLWRSGIKHDCSKVMEFKKNAEKYNNGYGDVVDIEDDHIYPMLKSSDISNGIIQYGRKYMLVTQKYVGEDTHKIKMNAPRTWEYLEKHKDILNKRSSSIYKNKPLFSVFGVGHYSFSPWKVAISGFYKKLGFQVIGSVNEKAVVFDDTVYFLMCWSEEEATFIASILNSKPAQEYYGSMIFWADKRPITIEILKRLDIRRLSAVLGKEETYLRFMRKRLGYEQQKTTGQLSLDIA